jgi:hypothetical protein
MDKLGQCSVCLNVMSSIAALWIMQCITNDAGVKSKIEVVKLAQRAGFCALSIMLMLNAAYTISSETSPRPIDLVLEMGIIAVLFISGAHNFISITLTKSETRQQNQ